ncbi:MAG: murein L,D-transpeptidase catalytic domain family protein [Marinifilaceae bacterium]
MKRLIILFVGVLILLSSLCSAAIPGLNSPLFLYNKMQLNSVINYDVFKLALQGYERIEGKQKPIITIIDFTKASTEDRFFVLDLEHKKLLYKSVVAHGRNSGENYAESFSNTPGSYKSSLGFYLTSETYMGNNGYSLRLEGLESGINDKAYQRAIVVHGAAYANIDASRNVARLGRSLGCPALPTGISKEVIETIKDGSVLFIYADSEEYKQNSSIIPQI